MNQLYSRIVEEEESDDDGVQSLQKGGSQELDNEQDRLEFFQGSFQINQFLENEKTNDHPNPHQTNDDHYADISFGENQIQKEVFIEQKENSHNQIIINHGKTSPKSAFSLKPLSAFASQSTTKSHFLISNENQESRSQNNEQLLRRQSSGQPKKDQIKREEALDVSFQQIQKVEHLIDRPKTANDNRVTLMKEEKQTYQPVYRINKLNVSKDKYFAYRSLSPPTAAQSDRSQYHPSQLNQNSPQFALSRNQNYCGRQLLKLVQEGVLESSVVQEQENDKKQIYELDERVLHSAQQQQSNVLKKPNKTTPNFFKKQSNELDAKMNSHFYKNSTNKISSQKKPFNAERSRSLSPSPPKIMQSITNKIPSSSTHKVRSIEDHHHTINTKATSQRQNNGSLDKVKQNLQEEAEIKVSPSSVIEGKYMNAMKVIEKAYERHDLNPKKHDVQFNEQYLTIARYTGQVKIPIDILDSESIYCKMYALSYNAYYIPQNKRQFPYYIDLELKSGDLEIYLSKSENPNIDNNDYLFITFDVPAKINYLRGEVKDGIYLNIFCRSQSNFSFRVVSETNLNSKPQKQQNGIKAQTKNQLTLDYKRQLIQEKASYNEAMLRRTRNKDVYVVDKKKEEQQKEDEFLESKRRESLVKNIVRENIQKVKSYSPNERKEHFRKQKHDKEVRIIRAIYNKKLHTFQELNKEILQIQRKGERKEQLIDADGRLEGEVRLLKQCFQYRWLQIFVLIQIIKVFQAKIRAHKVKEARNVGLTSPIMNLNALLSNYLKNKLGGDKYQRTFTRVHFCLKTRVKAFKKLMVYNASQVAGEFLQQKIKLMIIQQKMLIYYNHILMIQRSYRNLLQIRDQMNVVNLANWDVALKIMLDDEVKFHDKSWIAKTVLVDYKKRIEKNKVKTISHYVKMIQSQFFSKLKQYQNKLKKLPYPYQIAYSFCGKAFHTYFEKQYIKQIKQSFQLPGKRTNEYLIETLKFMVKHNVYQLVNNPITAYEKEKQKQLEAQKKKAIEALKQKEQQLQKQREEEFLQQKMLKTQKKQNNQQAQENEQSGSSCSSIDSNVVEGKKGRGFKDSLKIKPGAKKTSNLEVPISFQDYVQEEEKKFEELRAKRISKIYLEQTNFVQKSEKGSPASRINDEDKRKKKFLQKDQGSNFSMNQISMDDSVFDEADFSPKSQQNPFGSELRMLNSQKNSILTIDQDNPGQPVKIPKLSIIKRDFNEDSYSPRSSAFKRDKMSMKSKGKNGSFIISEKKAKTIVGKSPLKKSGRGGQLDFEEIESNMSNTFNKSKNSNSQLLDAQNDEEEEESEEEFDDNESYHEDIDNYLTKHHSPIKKFTKKNKKKSILLSRGEESMDSQRLMSSSQINIEDQKSKREDQDDNDENRKVLELTGSKKSSNNKKNEPKQSIFKNLVKNNNSSSESNHSMSSIQQLSQSNLSGSQSIPLPVNIPLTKDTSIQLSSSNLPALTDSQQTLQRDSQLGNSIPISLTASANRSLKPTKQKKKKSKKKKAEVKGEGKLEEIVEGDEATQTFWQNFIHYPIFMSYPNLTEMKELVIKLMKKL